MGAGLGKEAGVGVGFVRGADVSSDVGWGTDVTAGKDAGKDAGKVAAVGAAAAPKEEVAAREKALFLFSSSFIKFVGGE